MPISPLAPAAFPDLPVIGGVTFAAVAAGVKYRDRSDVMLALLAPGTSVAGAFTRSATRSAPVLDCQAKLGGDTNTPAAILVNSGNSNAFTGGRGVESVQSVVQAVAAIGGSGSRRLHRCAASAYLYGFDRCDRRTTAPRQDHRQDLGTSRTPVVRGHRGCRPSNHDNGYISQRGRCRDFSGRQIRKDRGHRQGIGHGRPRYGHDARIYFHRCRNGSGRVAIARIRDE